jgi:hypothetical protein
MSDFGTLQNDVLIGQEGHLFLASGGHHILDYVTGKRTVPAQSIHNFWHNISKRREYAVASGTKYVHIIFPDKQTVLTDYFPIDDCLSLGREYLAKIPFEATADARRVIFPVEALKGLGTAAFMKCDTHLTDLGTITIVAELVQHLEDDAGAAAVKDLVSSVKEEREHVGDLGSKLIPIRSAHERFLRIRDPFRWWHNAIYGGNNGIVDIRINNNARFQERVLVFGDSFARECVRILSHFFYQTLFARTGFFHFEVFDLYKPDILITANVERYLDFCQPDERRPIFFLYPYLSGVEYKPCKEFCEAFSAMLSYPREPYQQFLRSITNSLQLES